MRIFHHHHFENRFLFALVFPILFLSTSIIVLFLRLSSLCFPLRISNLLHRLRDVSALLVHGLVPLDVVLARDLFDFPSVSVGLFDQRLPRRVIESPLAVQMRLAAGDGQVQGGPVRDLTIMVEEPQIPTYEGREAHQVLCSHSAVSL